MELNFNTSFLELVGFSTFKRNLAVEGYVTEVTFGYRSTRYRVATEISDNLNFLAKFKKPVVGNFVLCSYNNKRVTLFKKIGLQKNISFGLDGYTSFSGEHYDIFFEKRIFLYNFVDFFCLSKVNFFVKSKVRILSVGIETVITQAGVPICVNEYHLNFSRFVFILMDWVLVGFYNGAFSGHKLNLLEYARNMPYSELFLSKSKHLYCYCLTMDKASNESLLYKLKLLQSKIAFFAIYLIEDLLFMSKSFNKEMYCREAIVSAMFATKGGATFFELMQKPSLSKSAFVKKKKVKNKHKSKKLVPKERLATYKKKIWFGMQGGFFCLIGCFFYFINLLILYFYQDIKAKINVVEGILLSQKLKKEHRPKEVVSFIPKKNTFLILMIYGLLFFCSFDYTNFCYRLFWFILWLKYVESIFFDLGTCLNSTINVRLPRYQGAFFSANGYGGQVVVLDKK